MRNAGGYAVITEDGRPPREADTFTCGHCQRIVHVPAKTDPANLGGHCRVCDHLICSRCVSTGMCDPFEKKIERAEASDRLYRAAHGG